MEKKIEIQAEQIENMWYVIGEGIKIIAPTQEHANAVSKYLMTAEILDPNFKPGRRKKSV